MPTVRIPPVLRTMTGDAAQVDVAGATLDEAIAQLCERHPQLRERLLDGEGTIQRFVNVYVDDEDVRTRQGLETPLRDDSSIIVLPAMAGG